MDEDGNNILHYLTKQNELSSLEELLNKHALRRKIGQSNNDGITPLHLAAMVDSENNLEIFKLLFKYHYNDQFYHNGLQPIHMACQEGNTTILEYILSHRSYRNDKRTLNMALIIAVKNNHLSCVKMLITSESTSNKINIIPAFDYAVYFNNVRILIILLRQLFLNENINNMKQLNENTTVTTKFIQDMIDMAKLGEKKRNLHGNKNNCSDLLRSIAENMANNSFADIATSIDLFDTILTRKHLPNNTIMIPESIKVNQNDISYKYGFDANKFKVSSDVLKLNNKPVRKVGSWVVSHSLGAGSFGDVRLGYNQQGTVVALKFIRIRDNTGKKNASYTGIAPHGWQTKQKGKEKGKGKGEEKQIGGDVDITTKNQHKKNDDDESKDECKDDKKQQETKQQHKEKVKKQNNKKKNNVDHSAPHVGDGGEASLKLTEIKLLQNEIEISKEIRHENVIKLLGLNLNPTNDNNYVMLIFEFAPHGALYNLLQKLGYFSPRVAKTYFEQMLDAVSYMHLHGIVHRDLKPTNLLLGLHFGLKICDFGLADFNYKSIGWTGGTAAYLAPELAEENVNARDQVVRDSRVSKEVDICCW